MTGAPELRDGVWWFRQPDGSLLRWDETAQAWQPVGPEAAAWNTSPPEPWLPIRRRATIARTLLFTIAGVALVGVVSSGFEYELLLRLEDGEPVSDSELDSNDTRQAAIGVVAAVLQLAIIVTFLMWFFRAYGNVRRLGARELRNEPGMAIGAWFIPIYWWWGPKKIANDIWRGSDPELPPAPGTAWHGAPIPRALFGLWWGAFILSSVGGFTFPNPDEIGEFKLQTLAWIAGDSLVFAAALLCAAVVGRCTERQEERAKRLGVRAAG